MKAIFEVGVGVRVDFDLFSCYSVYNIWVQNFVSRPSQKACGDSGIGAAVLPNQIFDGFSMCGLWPHNNIWRPSRPLKQGCGPKGPYQMNLSGRKAADTEFSGAILT